MAAALDLVRAVRLFRWRPIRVRRAHLDRRILLQALLEVIDNLHHRIGDPTILDENVVGYLTPERTLAALEGWKKS